MSNTKSVKKDKAKTVYYTLKMRYVVGLAQDKVDFEKVDQLAIEAYPDIKTKLNVCFMEYDGLFKRVRAEKGYPYHDVYYKTIFDFYSTDQAYLNKFEEYLRATYKVDETEDSDEIFMSGCVGSLNKKYEKGSVFQKFLPK